MLNWKMGTPKTESRVLVKNVPGFDPFRVFSAVVRKSPQGVVVKLMDEDRILRACELNSIMYALVAD